MYRTIILALIVAVGLGVLASLIATRSRFFHQQVRACFDDVKGLRPGADVRIAGVHVGDVRVVRADPGKKNCPAEIAMDLATPYELRIPKDSIAEIQTDGILGPPLVAIDVTKATGEPINNGGYLTSTHGPKDASSLPLR